MHIVFSFLATTFLSLACNSVYYRTMKTALISYFPLGAYLLHDGLRTLLAA